MLSLRELTVLMVFLTSLLGPATALEKWCGFNWWLVVLLTLPLALPLWWLSQRKRFMELNPSINSFRAFITSANVSGVLIPFVICFAALAWFTRA